MQLIDRLTLVIAGAARRGASAPACFCARDRTIGNLGFAAAIAPFKADDWPDAIASIDGIGATLDLRTCLCTSGTCTATIPAEAHPRGRWETAEELLGVFDAGCLAPQNQLQLMYSMTAGDTSISIAYGAGLQMPGNNDFVHVGVEAIQLTSAPFDNGTHYSYSCARGAMGTTPAPHRVSAITGTRPDVTPVATVWVGRTVYLCLDGVIWRRGLLSAVPAIEDGQIHLEFVLEDNRAAETPPTLDSLPEVRLYDDHIATTYEWYGMLVRRTETREIHCVTTGSPGVFRVVRSRDVTALRTELASSAYNSYSQFLIGTQGATGAPQNPPANPWNAGPTGIVECLVGDQLYLADRSGTALDTGTGVNESTTVQLLKWSRLYCAEVPRFTTLTTAAGLEQKAWENVISYSRDPSSLLLSEPFLEGYKLAQYPGVCVCLRSTVSGPPLQVGVFSAEPLPDSRVGEYERDSRYLADALVTPPGSGIRKLTARCSTGRTSATVENFVPQRGGSAPLGTCERAGWLCRYPVRFASEDLTQAEEVLSVRNRASVNWLDVEAGADVRIPVVCALRWYEPGFSHLRLEERPLGDPDYPCVRATWYEPDGEVRTCDLALGYAADGLGGYPYKVGRYDNPSKRPEVAGIGDWPGQTRATFRPICGQSHVTGGWALASLFASVDSTSGSREDRLPAGLAAAIKARSFRAWADPAGIAGWSWEVGDPDRDVSAEEFISSVLLITRTAVVGDPANDYRLVRIGVGAPTRFELATARAAGGVITDALIIGSPSSDTDRDVVTSYEMALPGGSRITWIDQDAIQRYGQGSSLKLDLSQAEVDGSGAVDLVQIFRGTLASLCENYGRARRVWRVAIPLERAEMWYLGQPVEVTSKYLYGYRAGRGVDAAPATIIAMEMHPAEGRCELTLWARRTTGGAYDVGCLIWYNSGTYLYVAQNEVSPDPTKHDVDYLQVGDAVRINLLAGSPFDRTITAIDKYSTYDRITLDSTVASNTAQTVFSYQGLVELQDPSVRATPYFLLGTDSYC